MPIRSFKFIDNKVIIRSKGRICETAEELISSKPFAEVVHKALAALAERRSTLLGLFGKEELGYEDLVILLDCFRFLSKMPSSLVPRVVAGSEKLFEDCEVFKDFVEYLYNFWRGFDRFIICESVEDEISKRPYRTFNETIEQLTHLVRGTYRDIQENLTGRHPWVYRQVSAGAEVAAIALEKKIFSPGTPYERLNKVPVIRQVLLYPPLVLNPPMNKRTGSFTKVAQNPVQSVVIEESEWLCYPAKVGPLLILIYFHEKFYELGFSLCNLFELADEADLNTKPDAVYLFGVPGDALAAFGEFPTVFYDDRENDLLAAAVPNRDEFGYFGYLKKMVLTLHNAKMMKAGRLPFHGALVKIILKEGREATVLMIGDTGAGKSETLEAFRILGKEYIRELIIVADDMGSLEVNDQGDILGYGTEIGAFLRLDDLQPGYAFGQIDRSIFMSPNQTNARVVIPVTTFSTVIKGYKVDYLLYANNYEEVDEEHPIIERLHLPHQALQVFREGAVMSKGTTTSKGLVHSYFANIFGPPQYKELHDQLSAKYFDEFFARRIFVGQIRTRLGIPGWEMRGPKEAAECLLQTISTGPGSTA